MPRLLHHISVRYPRWSAFGKVCPTSTAQSGMHFPQSTSTGNYVPFQRQIPGRIGTVKILSQIDRGGLGPALL